MNNKANYNKDTYIGYLKMKKGGMKIISGDIDNSIIDKRNKILGHLKKVLSGGKSLKAKYVEKYFSALGGKFIRSDMDRSEKDRKLSISGAHKLLKYSSMNNFPMEDILTKFKGSAPSLYKELEHIIQEGHSYNDNIPGEMYGGDPQFDIELNKLRIEINQLRNLNN
jgi:hypothetical protein